MNENSIELRNGNSDQLTIRWANNWDKSKKCEINVRFVEIIRHLSNIYALWAQPINRPHNAVDIISRYTVIF